MAVPHPGNSSATFALRPAPVNSPEQAVAPSTGNVQPAVPLDEPPTLWGAPPRQPTWLGEYEILGELGRGGMGVVYKARHRELGRLVALKMVRSAHFASEEELLRFRFEGEAAASLHHPNIVQVFEVGTYEGQPYMVLEYVDGGTLADWQKENRSFQPEQAAWLIESLARAVHVAHTHGIVHRDLKPGNILLANVDRSLPEPRLVAADMPFVPKIADFGLAKHLERSADLTETGRILGTPGYMAPEQAGGRSRDIGPATDVYALGAILYQVLSGRPPLETGFHGDTLVRVLTQEPVALHKRVSVPRDLETICHKCLEKEPARRYASAVEVAEDLARFREGKPVEARPVGHFERMLKWARRRPVVAGLLLGLVLVSFLGFAGVTVALFYALEGQRLASEAQIEADEKRVEALRERTMARQERDRAQEAQRNAVLARSRADEARAQAESTLVFNQMTRSLLEWRQNNLEASTALLGMVPGTRRGWGWQYLHGLHHGELLLLSRESMLCTNTVAFSPDGQTLVAGGGNPFATRQYGSSVAEVVAWNLADGKLLRTYSGFTGSPRGVAFSPDGRHLVGGGIDHTIRVWNAQTARPIRTFTNARDRVNNALLSSDGRVFAACGEGGLRVWELKNGKEIDPVEEKPAYAGRVCLSKDGRRLACSGKYVWVWDLTTRKKLVELPHANEGLTFSPGGDRIAYAVDRQIRVYSIPEGKLVCSLGGHEGIVRDVAFGPDGRLLGSAGSDGTVRLWDAVAGQELAVWRGHKGRVESVAFHPAGAMLASSSAQPGDVRVWDLTRPQEYLQVETPNRQNWVLALAFDPTGEAVMVLRKRGTLAILDATTGRARDLRSMPVCRVWRTPGTLASFSLDARTLVAVDERPTNEVRAWNLTTGDRLPGTYRHLYPVWQASVSGDGRLVASSARAVRKSDLVSELAVWETTTGNVRFFQEESNGANVALAVSPDGKRVARAIEVLGATVVPGGSTRLAVTSTLIEVWDLPPEGCLTNAPPRWQYHVLGDRVQGLAFSPDSARLAGASSSGAITLWHSDSGQPFGKGPLAGPPGVEGLAFAPDGRLLAGASRDLVSVWDVEEGLELLRVRGSLPRSSDGGFTPRVAWSPDGMRLAASNWEQTVSIWDGIDRESSAAKKQMWQAARNRLPRWHLDQAAEAWEQGNKESVRFHCQRLESLEPLDPAWYRQRGSLRARMGEWKKAEEDFRRGMPGVQQESGLWWRQWVVLLVQAGRLEEARQTCVRLSARFAEDDSFDSHLELARAFTLVPDSGAALREVALYLEGVLGLKDQQLRAEYQFREQLAWTYLRLGQPAKAITCAQDVLATSREDEGTRIPCYLILTLAHDSLGASQDARRWREQARLAIELHRPRVKERLPFSPNGPNWWDWKSIEILATEALR